MKRRYLYIMMACMTITMGIGLSGCGTGDSSQNTNVTEVSTTADTNSSAISDSFDTQSEATPEAEKNNTETNSQASSALPKPANDSRITMGNITSVDVDNNTITISVMQGFSGFNAGNRPGENNQPGELPEGFDTSDFQGQVPGGFDASNFQGQVPDGFNPSDFQGQIPDGFDASNFQDQVPDGFDGKVPDGTDAPSQRPNGDRTSQESKTYTVTGQTIITNQEGNTISLSDLSENTFVQFVAEEEDVLTSITVTNGQGGFGNN